MRKDKYVFVFSLFISLATITSFYQCTQNKKNILRSDSIKAPIESNPNLIEIVDNLLPEPFELEPTSKLLMSDTSVLIEFRPIVNMYDSTIMDTLINVKLDEAIFSFYKAKHNEILTQAVVTSQKFKLQKGIMVGMSKEEFRLKFRALKDIPFLHNICIVQDSMAYESLTFEFRADSLFRFSYEGYID